MFGTQPWRAEMLHSQEDHLLLWFTRGQGRIHVGARMQGYGPNSVFFIPANLSHRFEAQKSKGMAIHIRSLDILHMPRDPLILRIMDVHEQGQLAALVDNLQKELDHSQISSPRACLYHTGLLGIWLERMHAAHSETPKKNATRDLVNKYLTLIETRFASGENVSDLAKVLDVTPTHLTRSCQKCFGQSALSLLNERIHYEARDLLGSTNIAINEIARDLGFRSAAYFTRTFIQMAGQTPREFRNSTR